MPLKKILRNADDQRLATSFIKTMQLSKLGEFRLIKRLNRLCKNKSASKDILFGIGDDAAAIKTSTKTTLITSDMLLEGVHFDLSFTTFFQLGYKILAVNISDMFAMDGKPRYFLLNLGIPKTHNSQEIEEIYKGITKIAGKFGVAVIGGDTCISKSGLVLSGALMGEAGRFITRSGARPGDSIFVTGALGDSAMGLELLIKMGVRIDFEKQRLKGKGRPLSLIPYPLSLLKRHLMPEPVPLEKTSNITSMIDISDGLLIDLSHICDESGVGAVIYKDKIPMSRELVNTAKKLSKDPFKFALKGGEDYILLFTAPSKTKKNAVRIGEIIKKGSFIVDSKGKKTSFKAEGYEHFKSKSNIKNKKSKLWEKEN